MIEQKLQKNNTITKFSKFYIWLNNFRNIFKFETDLYFTYLNIVWIFQMFSIFFCTLCPNKNIDFGKNTFAVNFTGFFGFKLKTVENFANILHQGYFKVYRYNSVSFRYLRNKKKIQFHFKITNLKNINVFWKRLYQLKTVCLNILRS